MNRPHPTRLALCFTLVALGASEASARIDPPFSSAEKVWFSADKPGAPETKGDALRWTEKRGVQLAGKGNKKAALWVAGGGFGSGLARMTVDKPKGLSASLAIRAVAGPAGLSAGYRLRVARGRAHLERVQGGRATGLVRSRAFKRPKSIELVLAAYGDVIVARIYDARTGRQLTALTARDGRLKQGRVALEVEARSARKAVFRRLSSRRGCRSMPPATPKAPPLFVTAAHADMASIDYREMERLAGGQVVGRVSLPELERLVCAGKRPAAVSIDMPYKYRDADYRSQRLRYRKGQRKIPMDASGAPRLDLSVKNPKMVKRILAEYARRHPKLTRLDYLTGGAGKGRTHRGRRIPVLVVGKHANTPQKSVPSFLIIGAHHGNEPMSVEFVLDAIHRVLEERDERAQQWLEHANLFFVPVTNPDGLHAFLEQSDRLGRKNGREQDSKSGMTLGDGVDLNRNYPFKWKFLGEKGSKSNKAHVWYRGPSPGSEPETQAVMALADEEHFAGLLTYHGGTVALLAPYTIDNVQNPPQNEAWMVAEDLIKGIEPHPQKKNFRVRVKLYSVDGTDQDWHRFTHGTVALLVEGSRSTPTSASGRRAVTRAVRPLFERLLDRFLLGPSVSGVVVDAEGRPVNAVVRVAQVATQEGEQWRTRCRDGRFDRYLPGPGKYDVIVELDGKEAARQTITVAASPPTVAAPLRFVVNSPPAGAVCPPASR